MYIVSENHADTLSRSRPGEARKQDLLDVVSEDLRIAYGVVPDALPPQLIALATRIDGERDAGLTA